MIPIYPCDATLMEYADSDWHFSNFTFFFADLQIAQIAMIWLAQMIIFQVICHIFHTN